MRKLLALLPDKASNSRDNSYNENKARRGEIPQTTLLPADTIDWGELSSQPILKVDEPICLKSSRRNFKILRARLEQETAENHFFGSLTRCGSKTFLPTIV